MASGCRRWPYAIAALGAAGLLVSLWLPWYSFTIPQSFLDRADGLAGQFGVLAPLITQGAELARHLGELHVSAWRVLNQIDIVLALLAGTAGGTSLVSISDRASVAGRLIAGAGARPGSVRLPHHRPAGPGKPAARGLGGLPGPGLRGGRARGRAACLRRGTALSPKHSIGLGRRSGGVVAELARSCAARNLGCAPGM